MKHRERCNNEKMEVSGSRKIGRPKQKWGDITQDTNETGAHGEVEELGELTHTSIEKMLKNNIK